MCCLVQLHYTVVESVTHKSLFNSQHFFLFRLQINQSITDTRHSNLRQLSLSVKNDQWPLITDHWPLTIDQWSLITDHWSLTIDQWSLTTDHWSLTTDHWPLIIDHWSLITDHWPLIIDHWLSTIDRWSKTIDHWPLIIDHWPLTTDYRSLIKDHWSLIINQRKKTSAHSSSSQLSAAAAASDTTFSRCLAETPQLTKLLEVELEPMNVSPGLCLSTSLAGSTCYRGSMPINSVILLTD